MTGNLSFPLIRFTTTRPPRYVFRLVSASSVSSSYTHISVNNGNSNLNEIFPCYNKHLREWGPPRWFSPLNSSCSQLPNPPLLLYLPGIGGSGLGLSSHYRKLGEMFDIWCLHIPSTDRAPFSELVNLVETAVKSQNYQSPGRPIYLVGQSFEACLALAIAARNPDIDILLVLANSATSFND